MDKQSPVSDYTQKNTWRQWVNLFLHQLTTELTAQGITPAADISQSSPEASPSLSLQAARLINFLNKPFFWGGIVFLGWLIVNPVVISSFPSITQIVDPWENIIGSTVVGYWTNWLAIKMLFYPRRPNRIWQGLIPARRQTLIELLVEGISANLFSPAIVAAYLKKHHASERLAHALQATFDAPELRSAFRVAVKQGIADFLNRPSTKAALSSMLEEWLNQWKAQTLWELPLEASKKAWQPSLIRRIIAILPEISQSLDPLLDHFEAKLHQTFHGLAADPENFQEEITALVEKGFQAIRIEEIIRHQLSAMDESELERLLTAGVTTELVFLQTSGGVFGLLVGLAVTFPWLRLVLAVTALILWIIYQKSVAKD